MSDERPTSRSMAKRIAAQKGEPPPEFEPGWPTMEQRDGENDGPESRAPAGNTEAATPSPRPSVESLLDAYRDALARWHTGAPNPLTTIAADMARAAVLAEHERQVREARLAAIEECANAAEFYFLDGDMVRNREAGRRIRALAAAQEGDGA